MTRRRLDAYPTPEYDDGQARLYVGDCREVLRALPGESVHAVVTDPPYEFRFMARAWDGSGVAFEVDTWREVLRVMKPGAHLVAFGGARTHHRLWCAVEDAGFELRDTLMWLYGSGFPKSLDVAKAIDRQAGHWRGRRGAVTAVNRAMSGPNYERAPKGDAITDAAHEWHGWGTALKPAYEPIVLARRPLAGTVVANVQQHGTGALNVDGCRVPTGERWHGRETNDERSSSSHPGGRWPANVILDPEAATMLDEHRDQGSASRLFYVAKAATPEREAGLRHLEPQRRTDGRAKDIDNPRLRTSMRRNMHPTVKPLALIRWLMRLVTPLEGIVLDPFLGSGTTAVAAFHEGFRCIGADLSEEYAQIAIARYEHARAQGRQLALDLAGGAP